ncbi:thioredoxin [Methanohalobium evestigatum Z-7303]|uniref:Thioredoxin n=2 Tax=Methanohalobium TaxID=2321 RepID=D7E7H4_METEZ|nr:thioredoxin [Methanohalobium evestigatum]ADI73923.1 thioredoxin [Methanohalobium evestigatum Z-7303]
MEDLEELEEIRKKKIKEIQKSMERRSYPSKPFDVTDSNVDETVSKYPLVVIDCWAEWCGPCKKIAPAIEELASEYQGKAVFAKLDVDNNQESAKKFGISSIPTLLIFKNKVLIDYIIGAVSKQDIIKRLQPHM